MFQMLHSTDGDSVDAVHEQIKAVLDRSLWLLGDQDGFGGTVGYYAAPENGWHRLYRYTRMEGNEKRLESGPLCASIQAARDCAAASIRSDKQPLSAF